MRHRDRIEKRARLNELNNKTETATLYKLTDNELTELEAKQHYFLGLPEGAEGTLAYALIQVNLRDIDLEKQIRSLMAELGLRNRKLLYKRRNR